MKDEHKGWFVLGIGILLAWLGALVIPGIQPFIMFVVVLIGIALEVERYSNRS